MSANNKAICPQCKQNKNTLASAAVNWILNPENMLKPLQPTLAEDYEIHTDEYGVLFIKYDCACPVCGFEFSYTKYIDIMENR